MANQSPLAYTGRVLASTSQIGVCQFDSQDFSVSQEGVVSLGASITAPGSLSTTTFLSAGTQLRCNGGAATDFIGQAILVNGVVTVANTNITANDRIFCTVSAKNATTTFGHLVTSITPATSFTITSFVGGTPASIQTNDQSTIDYFIVRQF